MENNSINSVIYTAAWKSYKYNNILYNNIINCYQRKLNYL